ncbi:MAG: MFS transporter [Chloroflexota bacterium]|nr:MFS transporter [Chloroflexota bacterium]
MERFDKIKPRIFYGWWVVAAAAMVAFASCGIGYYSFAIFLKPIEAEFGWSRTALSGAMSLLLLVSGLLSPLVGRWCDTYGSKKIIMLCSIPLGVCFVLFNFVQSLWHFYAIYALLALPFAGTFIVPATTLVTKWFDKKRGIAIALVLCGSSLGGLVLPPALSYLIATIGWRMAYVCSGILTWLIILPLAIFVIKSNPQEMGLSPDGEKRPTDEQYNMANSSEAPQRWTLAMALRTSLFWFVALGFAFVVLGRVGVMTHQVAYLTDIGIDTMAAATALGVTSGIAIIGRLAVGYLADRTPKRFLAVTSFALEAVGVFILMRVRNMKMVWLYVIVFGIGFGGEPAIRPLLIGELFGTTSFGAVFGAMQAIIQLGTALGPLLAGYIFDTTASYHLAFIIFLITYILAIISILFAKRPKQAV